MGESAGVVLATVLASHNHTLLDIEGLSANTPGVHSLPVLRRLNLALARNRMSMRARHSQPMVQGPTHACCRSAAACRLLPAACCLLRSVGRWCAVGGVLWCVGSGRAWVH